MRRGGRRHPSSTSGSSRRSAGWITLSFASGWPRCITHTECASLREYLELREIRLLLEPHAAAEALPQINDEFIAQLEECHALLVQAEQDKDYPAALLANYEFHFSVYRRSNMPELIQILEKLLTLLYPSGHPTYDGPHQHLNVLAALKARDASALAEAFRSDLIEGGRSFVGYLESNEEKSKSSGKPSRERLCQDQASNENSQRRPVPFATWLRPGPIAVPPPLGG
jgi:hypothetical protein